MIKKVACLICLFISAPAYAELPGLDTRTWRPGPDPKAQWAYEPTEVAGAGTWAFRALTSYEHVPVQITQNPQGLTVTPIRHALRADVSFNMGLGDHFAAGLSLPFSLYTEGEEPLATNLSSRPSVPNFSLGDLTLHGKLNLRENKNGGLGLASLLCATFPTGDSTSFLSEKSLTFTPKLLIDYSLLVASIQGSLGYSFRGFTYTWPSPDPKALRYGGSLPYSLALRLNPMIFKIDRENRHSLELAAQGSLPFGPTWFFEDRAEGLASFMMGASDRIEIGAKRNWYTLLSFDVGLTRALGTPSFRIAAALGYTKVNTDADRDGIEDEQDECKDIPEDKDGFEDTDGCPDIDNDQDGIMDVEDQCPNQTGLIETQGCPDKDSDGDGILDHEDACPHEKGQSDPEKECNGCNVKDNP